MNYLSFLVDNLPLHYYQAELLLFSLEKFTSFNKNQIIVHCTTRVNDAFLFFLKENKYEYRVIEPYLDGKYCNKLQQLPTFDFLTDKDAVFLVDADTFFLNDPILVFSSKIGGKVVDAPNPPLSVLSKIFNEANLSYPKIVPSDWVMENAYTFECNFNGGFYYIPGKDVEKANKLWRKWATWLYERSYLFDTETQSIHTDQVSFAMMVQEGNFDYQVVVSNNNSPIHRNTKQRLFDDSKEVAMLHYHRSLNAFGLLETSLSINNVVDKAIKSINEAIAEKGNFEFYKQFNKSFIRPTTSTEKTKVFEKKLLALGSEYTSKKIILHAGTPKTGTTSLQFLLDNRYEELLQQGILYPKYYLDINPPKHQWLVQLLRANNFDGLFEYLEKILREAKEKQVETIFLSTEGIFNHWWDFSAEAKEVLKIIAKKINFELYVVFREPSLFLESFYKQNLKNPQNSAARCYGQDWSFEEMMKDKWFNKHIDYLGFLQELETLFGKESVRVFIYSKEIVETILKNMGFTSRPDLNTKKENLGQSSIGVALLRVLNQYNLNAKDKKECIYHLKNMDKHLLAYSKVLPVSQDEKENILRLFRTQSQILYKEYNLNFYNQDIPLKVPKILIQFWHDKSRLPQEYKDALENNKQYLNGYEVLFVDDEYMLSFLEKNDLFLYELYKNIQIESIRSDFTRLILLLHFGGIYLDISMVLLKPLEMIVKEGSEVGLLCRDDQERYAKYPKNAHIANGILYAVKESSFIQMSFKDLLDSIINGHYNHLVSFATTKNTNTTYMNYKRDSQEKTHFNLLSFKELKKDFLKHLRINGLANSWRQKEQNGIIDPTKLSYFQEEYLLYKYNKSLDQSIKLN